MMRSMYSAVSGLRVHQSKMDTIGNNIANVNTVGFKRGQVTFQEVFSQVVRGASAPQGGKGGTNPQQIGMGVATGSISTVHTKGPGQRTDNATDLMIDGEGFFVISSDPNYNNRYYTRAGNFTLDRDGNLVTAEGDKVLGYGVDGEGNVTSDITNIRINMSETKAPTATDKIVIGGNLNSEVEVGTAKAEHKTDTVIRDSLGNSYNLTFKFTKDAKGEWTMSIDKVTDNATGKYTSEVDQIEFVGDGIQVESDGGIKITFTDNGELATIGGKNVRGDTDLLDNIKLTGLNDIEFKLDKKGEPTEVKTPNGSFSDITIFDIKDESTFKSISQYANEMDLKPEAKTGNTSGTLEGFTIDATGTVLGVFTNGERKVLGQLMLAKFDNPMGLQKLGGNNFIDTRNSGEPQLGKAGTSGLGAISPGNLEMSNVDISLEFTEMITTQRGFQANSRIITTSDEMLQELVNMKR